MNMKHGFTFYFDACDETAEIVFNFVLKERKCCRSLRFEIIFEKDEGYITLKLSGPGEIKEFIYNSFNISQLNQN